MRQQPPAPGHGGDRSPPPHTDRGAQSAPWINAAWGTANLLAGLALARRVAGGEGRWDSRLVAFDLGAAAFATWMASSEAAMRVNWHGKDDR